jgi:hypothetical protein
VENPSLLQRGSQCPEFFSRTKGGFSFLFWIFCPISVDYGWFWAKRGGVKCPFGKFGKSILGFSAICPFGKFGKFT